MYMIFIAVAIGLLSGAGAILLRLAIKEFQVPFFGEANPSLEYIREIPWFMKIIIPASGGLIVGAIIHLFARDVLGHGVPEVMEAVARKGGVLRPKVVLTNMVSTAISIASGGSVGREGPIVHIGSAIGSAVGQALSIIGGRLRTLVGCGAAAGIAAAFNAPIAGALFAVEVVLEDFGVAHFSPIVISSVTATILSRHTFGDFPAFEVPAYELVSAYEMIPYALLGLLAGLAAVLFIKSVYFSADIFDSLRIHPILRTAIGGACVGIIALGFPQVYGVGYETINHALHGNFGGILLLGILAAKMAATSLSVGSGASGGIFAPSLFMGSMLGGVVGTYAHHAFPHETAWMGAYALVGMGAFVAGTVHAPISAILIIFELTNDYRIILPLMVSCIISTIIATRLQKFSIYTLKLVRKGIHIHRGRDINILKDISAFEFARTQVLTLHRHANFDQIIQAFIQRRENTVFVRNDDGTLAGTIHFEHLRKVLPEWEDLKHILVAEDLLLLPDVTLSPADTLDRAMRLFSKRGEDELPIVGEDGIFLGTLSKNDTIEVYNRELLKHDVAFEVREGISDTSFISEYPLSVDYILSSIRVPHRFQGSTIGDLALRTRYQVEVVLIKRENGEAVFPDASTVLGSDSTLVVIGKRDAIERIRGL